MTKDSKLIFEAYANREAKDDAFINKNLANALTPIKDLNNVNAVKYIDKRATEMVKRARGYQDYELKMSHAEKPFFHDESTGKLRALVSLVGPDGRPVEGQHYKKVTIDPNMTGSKRFVERVINIAVQEYLDMVDDLIRWKKPKGEAEESTDSNNFIDQIKAKTKDSSMGSQSKTSFFGKTDDGRVYTVIAEYDRYSDGDRWIDEEDYYYQVEGEEKGKYISEEQAMALLKQIATNHSNLNNHLDSRILDFYKK